MIIEIVNNQWRIAGKYGVKFDLFAKINVNGDDAHPLWKFLKLKQSGFVIE